MSTDKSPITTGIVWGHDGPLAGPLWNEIMKYLSGTEAMSFKTLGGENEFTLTHLQLVASAERAVIALDGARGVDRTIQRQIVLLDRAGLNDLIVVIGTADGSISKKRFDELERELVAYSNSMCIREMSIAPGVSVDDGTGAGNGDDGGDFSISEQLLDILNAPQEPVAVDVQSTDFRLAVTAPPSGDGLEIEGAILSGHVGPGDKVVALPSSDVADVMDIANLEVAGSLQLHLGGSVKIEPGQLIAAAGGRPEVADQIRAKLYWSSETPLLSGRPYIIELAGQTATATVTDIRFRESYESREHIAAKRLHQGELGEVNLSFDKELAFDAFSKLPQTGIFRLSDKTTNEELGVGFIKYGLRRATNIHRQAIDIDVGTRAQAKGQRPCCIWFTGLSGSGKSAVANALEKRLFGLGRHTYLLDGDNVRHGLNRDLGFTDADRVENIRRIGEVAKLMVDAGLIVMTAFISPFRSERRMARELFGDGEFIEVFVDTPLEVCEARDPKGLYKKARAGEIKNFTGIDSSYEAPEGAELAIHAGERTIEQLVDEIIGELEARGMLIGG